MGAERLTNRKQKDQNIPSLTHKNTDLKFDKEYISEIETKSYFS